jgi:hypothetical protein
VNIVFTRSPINKMQITDNHKHLFTSFRVPALSL